MRINKSKDNCSGCTLCSSVCPVEAIKMVPDGMGFLYPEIDNEKCIDCGLCDRICPFHDDYRTPDNFVSPLAYAGKHKDLSEVDKSQSGAAFVALSDWILQQGGVVYGVGYDGGFRACHKRAVSVEERDEFRGSKYVQSDMTGIYRKMKGDLADGKMVMFSGTPCQTAAVSAYFAHNRNRSNLFVMDIVCHGVPGPFLWRDYLAFLELKEGRKITKVNFRDKRYKGWRSHFESFEFEHTHTYTYTYLFYSHINLRYSCAKCPFTNLRRTADITVADFWGVENTEAASLGADNRGCSLFLVNTPKGKEWFDGIQCNLISQKVLLNEQCLQPQLKYPSHLSKHRTKFEEEYLRHGFSYVYRKYGNVGINLWINRLKNLVRPVYKLIVGKK